MNQSVPAALFFLFPRLVFDLGHLEHIPLGWTLELALRHLLALHDLCLDTGVPEWRVSYLRS
jgi:hypothetical protein